MFFDDLDGMQDDNLQNDAEYMTDSSSYDSLPEPSVSFAGHIDDIYDPQISRAYDSLNNHTEDLLHARTADEAKASLANIKEDSQSIDYWEDCKRNAMVESQKNDIFLDGINAQLEIIKKYRK